MRRGAKGSPEHPPSGGGADAGEAERQASLPWAALTAAGLLAASPENALGHEAEQPEEVTLEQVIIQADPFRSRTESDVVRPTTVLREGNLERRRQAGTIGEALDGLPGVGTADFGPAVGRPTIRGLQGARVEELQDGMRISDVSDEGVDHPVGGDARRAEAIELIRGPASLIYGSGAAGGVVNIVTGRFDPAIGDGPSGRLYGAYTDNANERQGFAGLGVPLHERFELRVDYSTLRTDDAAIKGFQSRDPGKGERLIKDTLVNSDVDDRSWSLTGMWSERWGYIGFGYDRWELEYGVPEPFSPVHPQDDGEAEGLSDEFERITAKRDRFDLRSEFYDPFTGFDALHFNASYTELDQVEEEFEFDDATGRLDEIQIEDVFEQEELDARLELSHQPVEPLGGLDGVVGLDFRDVDYLGENPEGDDLIRPTGRTAMAVFLVEELPTAFGALEFGARLGRERSDPADVTDQNVTEVGPELDQVDEDREFPERPGARTFTTRNAAIGARIEVDARHQVRSSVTYAERAPSAEQLYAFARHGAAGTWEVGDPDLDEERYLNIDLALQRPRGETRYEVAVFFNRVDDYVVLESFDDTDGNVLLVEDDGNQVTQADGGDILVFNTARDVHFYGAELEAAQDFSLAELPATARVSGDYVRGRLRDGGSLPRMTAPRLGVGLDTSWHTLDVGVDWRHVFRQEDTAAGEQNTDSFNLVSFDVTWKPREVAGLRLFFRGRNLLDEAGRRHESFFADHAPIRGRAYTAGLSYDF